MFYDQENDSLAVCDQILSLRDQRCIEDAAYWAHRAESAHRRGARRRARRLLKTVVYHRERASYGPSDDIWTLG